MTIEAPKVKAIGRTLEEVQARIENPTDRVILERGFFFVVSGALYQLWSSPKDPRIAPLQTLEGFMSRSMRAMITKPPKRNRGVN